MTGAPLRLVIFDVDGTLVDSQNDIVASMRVAYGALDMTAPDREAILGIVGLSLPAAFARLSPDLSDAARAALCDGYKTAYAGLRLRNGAMGSPLFPGARRAIDILHAQPETLLAIATGKSRRGLTGLIDVHGLGGRFVSTQVADDHPSKPHPSMVMNCLTDAGVDPCQAVMVGDTTYDMEMARAAGVQTIGVAWGYHRADTLGADAVIKDFAQLPGAVDALLENAQ